MHRYRAVARVLAILVVLSGCASTAKQRPSAAPEDGCAALSGAWEGTLPVNTVRSDASTGHDEITLRLVFAGEHPTVLLVERGTWVEAKPGRFVARCLGASAVVHAIDSARDDDGTWIESWILAVTMRDRDELMTRWMRMVNNVDLPLTNRSSKFSSEASGILRRTSERLAKAPCPVEPVGESTQLGDFLERLCSCGQAPACGLLASAIAAQGGTENLTRAKELRQKACELGHQASCNDPK